MSRYCLTVGLFLGLLARSFSPIYAADMPAKGTVPFLLTQKSGRSPDAEPTVVQAVRQAMQDRDYTAARKAIDDAAKAKDAPSDYLAYLRAWSFYLEKQNDQAIAALEKFEKDYPQSNWLRRARFAKAQAMVGKGDFRGAQAIYERQAKYLLSDGRRQQSAEVYLEFGDARFQPPSESQKPDYNAARQLYSLALDNGLSGPRRAEVEFRIGVCLQKLGASDEAAKSFADFLVRHGDDSRLNEIRYRLGECLLAAGKPVEARKAWRELLSGLHAPAPFALPAGKSRDWPAEAAFHLAETWRCPQPRDDDDLRRGVAALRDFLARFPKHELAGQAHLAIADSQIYRKHYDDAVTTLQNFLRDPRWKDCKELAIAQRELGNVYLTQKKYLEALATWREYLARYPAHEGWSAVQRSVIDAEYAMGLEKVETGDYDPGIRLLTEFMAHYPLDDRNPGILLLFGQIQHRQKKWEAAVGAWQRLVEKYPHASEARSAELLIARTLDEQLGRYDEAREHYKKADDTAAAAAISARQMLLETPRAFRSDETPQLKLATRNVPAVNVRVYKIDLETYFRKMHTVAGIERLDVSLIDPDATFEFAVPGFAKYKPVTSNMPVPLPDGLKAGVAAVTVTSPAQETTTLLIQSDLEIVVRASRGESLVFAENMRTGKPWPGVRLLLSDGKSVFAEGKTGDDGTFVQQFAEADQPYILRVFAVADGGHSASTAVPMPTSPAAVELSDRLTVATDRAEYRAGEPVHVRGCARNAVGDLLAVEPGKKLSVEMLDSADRRLRRKSVTLSALGTFACDLPLPLGMPEGSYSVVVSDGAGHHRTAQFEIASPPEDVARLVIDVPRHVYYRGETVEGTFRVVLPQDRRLSDAKIEYRLDDLPSATATADARGEAHFAIATEELEGPDDRVLSASVPSRGLSAQCNLTVATRGFSIELSTARPVFVEGENIEVKVKTADAANQPIAENLHVKVTKHVTQGDEPRDEPVEEHSLATAADGTTKLTLRPAKGGRYTISASDSDRFGNTIEHSLKIRISDENDPERLLLLVDRSDLKSGDTADVQVYWRGEPATALVTTHYDRLREHRLMELHNGSNRLALPVTAAMAPGFTLALAVMDQSSGHPGAPRRAVRQERTVENRVDAGTPAALSFYEAECQFTVDPNLQVKLECHRHGDLAAKPRPGEPIDVTITTCDGSGKPVAAEVGLSVLSCDRASGDQEPHGARPSFALGRGHDAEFHTASSIQFHYRPLQRVLAAEVPDANTATIPPGISPQVGVNVRPSQPAAKAAPGDDPFGDAPSESADEKGDRKADFAALKAEIEKTVKSQGNDDPFGADAGPAARKTSDASKPARAVGATDPFGPEPGDTAENPAPKVSPIVKRQLDTPAVTHFAKPAWPGYWSPSIATGPDGRATVTIAPPSDAAELTLAARAIAAGNLAGQTAQKLALTKNLAAEIRLPPAFTDGDEVEIPVVIQNNAIDQGEIEVQLSMDAGGTIWSQKRTLTAKGHRRLETSFKPLVRQPQRPPVANGSLPERPEAVFYVTAKAGRQTDVVRRRVPIRAYGAKYQVAADGVFMSDTAFFLAPSRQHWTAPTLQIAISSSIQQGLLDLLDDDVVGRYDPLDSMERAGLPAAGNLMAALALTKLHPQQSAEARLLDEKIHQALCLLIATQQPDGGWLVHGRPAALTTRAVAYWSLVLADKAGYQVPREVLEAALANIRQGLAHNTDDDFAVKAVVLHALTLRGQGDFALANQLLRDRKSLSSMGRAYLALALVQMDRKDSAAEILKDLETSSKVVDIEAQALTALAMLSLDTASPQAKAMAEALLARRQGLRWNPENATGPAVMAAVQWLAQNRAAEAPSRVSITVNGKALKTVQLDPHGPTLTVDVPMSLLVKGKQQIAIHSTGAARIAYRAMLTGVEPAENVAGSSAAWHIERSYEPPLMEIDDRKIPRGFTALSGDAYAAAFSNRMTQLPAARRGFVELAVYCKRSELAADESLATEDPELTIVEPLPSGATVVESSLAGPFDRAEILPGRIVFYLRHGAPNSTIRYQIEGAVPGANLVSPTILRRAGRDAPLAAAKPKVLVVFPQGAKSSDPYRLSPDELLALGELAKRKGDEAAATRCFDELLEKWHGRRGFDLDEPAYKQTVFALMELGMGRAAPAKLVQYCETIKEKWPQEPVTLDQLLTAAGAYREIGEIERSYIACRAAVEGSFTRECGVAGFLDNQGEFLRSVGLMERLMRDYPPEPYAADAGFGLAQRVYSKAGEMQPADPQARQPGMEREALIARAGTMLEAFLTGFPHDPAADQAAFAAANTQLDLKHYAAAAEAAAAAARRYPKSDLLDSYWYMLAYCDFALGKYPAAIDMCRKVSQAQHLDKETGRMVDSQNKYRAIYILGQIFQSLGQRGDAIREYRRVEDRIPDARSSVAFFVRKEIALPECTTLKPGATASVELRYRNIVACDIKVYRVDLMKFCEAGQALGDMSQVNLSGIRPLSQTAMTLAGSGDYADHVQKLALPLKNDGAYLVVCRGDDLYASGLLLISPLEIEQRIDAASNQVRVFVKDATTGHCAGEVQVKLLPRGANVQANVTGTTDLRGIFMANSPTGGATIVAQAGPGQYAYIAAPPLAAAPPASIAQSHFPDIDPTAPFGDDRFAELEKLIRETPPTKSWLDNGGSGTLTEFPTNLSLVLPRGAAASAAGSPRESVERPLPPLGPNSPSRLAGEESASERKIRAALASPAAIAFAETPLKDVVEQLRKAHHIEIELDTAGLKDAGVDEASPVTKTLSGVSLASALRQILDELQLKYVIHNEVLLITSPQKAESDEFMVTKAYPVQDLVQIATDGTVDMKPLMDLIQNTVATKSWIDNGGNGTISEIIVGNRALLVMSQTQEVHEELEDILETLRKAGGLKSAARKLAEKEQTEDETDLPERPRSRLHSPANGSSQTPFVISVIPTFDGRAPQGARGGMGGMGGGMGGMGMGGMGFGGQGGLRVQQQAGPGGDADLLGGLRSANSANQQSKALILKQRQDAGQNGAAGMGGGFF